MLNKKPVVRKTTTVKKYKEGGKAYQKMTPAERNANTLAKLKEDFSGETDRKLKEKSGKKIAKQTTIKSDDGYGYKRKTALRDGTYIETIYDPSSPLRKSTTVVNPKTKSKTEKNVWKSKSVTLEHTKKDGSSDYRESAKDKKGTHLYTRKVGEDSKGNQLYNKIQLGRKSGSILADRNGIAVPKVSKPAKTQEEMAKMNVGSSSTSKTPKTKTDVKQKQAIKKTNAELMAERNSKVATVGTLPKRDYNRTLGTPVKAEIQNLNLPAKSTPTKSTSTGKAKVKELKSEIRTAKKANRQEVRTGRKVNRLEKKLERVKGTKMMKGGVKKPSVKMYKKGGKK